MNGGSRNGGEVVTVGSTPELSEATGNVKLTVAVPSDPTMTSMSPGQCTNTGGCTSVTAAMVQLLESLYIFVVTIIFLKDKKYGFVKLPLLFFIVTYLINCVSIETFSHTPKKICYFICSTYQAVTLKNIILANGEN